MVRQSLSLHVDSAIGNVSAEYIVPDTSICIMTLAHGAGAGMNHGFMHALAISLAEVGIATLRYNFPFIENGKKRADVPAVAHKTVAAAIRDAKTSFSALPLFVGGKSFGGRMSSQFLAQHPDTSPNGVIFYGFPLHPDGKPSIERAEHLKQLSQPMLFLQGTRDKLATMTLLEEACSGLDKATLVKIEGADHAFKAGKKDLIPTLAQATRAWIDW